jgi:FixJ family two-component response regulator
MEAPFVALVSSASLPAVTAYSNVPHAVKAMKLGAIDFLQKPLCPEELRGIVPDFVYPIFSEQVEVSIIPSNLV